MGLPVLAQPKERKQKTTPFGVYLMKSQVLYRAAQYLAQRLKAAIPAVFESDSTLRKLQELLPLGAGPGTGQGQPGVMLGFSIN